MSKPASTLAPFRHGNFRNIWTANLASNLGGLVQGVGAGWMMTTITDSHNMVSLVQGATTLPVMIFSIAAGALADNFDRRRIMLVAQAFMMGVSVCLAIWTFLGLLSPWMLLGFTFLIGCGTALNNPSWQASMGDIVPREDLPSAVSLNSMGFNLMRSVGPAIGGIIVATAGAVAAFAFNALSYIPLFFALFRWKSTPAQRTLPRERFGGAMAAGVRYVAMSPKLLTVLARGFVFGLGAVSIAALLPTIASEYVGGSAFTYGTMLGCFGAGAIGGALINARAREKLANEIIARLACLGFALSCAGLGLSRDVLLSHAVLLPAGVCWVLALSLFNVTIQLSTPRWVVGRALSLYQTATFGGMAAGSWVWGMTSDSFSPTIALLCAALVLLGCAAIGLRFSLPEFGNVNFDPSDPFREPAVALDIRPQSGPIVVEIEYDIAPEDIPAFLRLMAVRRRIRIRDGARRWALRRDLERPEIWSEIYHVPTWVEYVRHLQRRTMADGENSAQLLALHRGADRPRVRRTIERPTVPLRDDTPYRDHPEVST